MSAPSKLDPVRAQAILVHTVHHERLMADTWQKKWGFFKDFDKALEVEAKKRGVTLDELKRMQKDVCRRDAEFKVGSADCLADPGSSVDGAPHDYDRDTRRDMQRLTLPFPTTSAGAVGRRALSGHALERFGRLIYSSKDLSLEAPHRTRSHTQLYNPYRQTFLFTGVHLADPITHHLPPLLPSLKPETVNQPLQYQLERSQFSGLVANRIGHI